MLTHIHKGHCFLCSPGALVTSQRRFPVNIRKLSTSPLPACDILGTAGLSGPARPEQQEAGPLRSGPLGKGQCLRAGVRLLASSLSQDLEFGKAVFFKLSFYCPSTVGETIFCTVT